MYRECINNKDFCKKKRLPQDIANLVKTYPSTRCEGLPGELPLFVGMPVILTNNIGTELGLTNGTTGVVKFICFNENEVITGDTGIHYLKYAPDYVIVEVDDVHMTPLEGLQPNHVPIFPLKKSFGVRMKGKKKDMNVNREHFPLVPRFSCTAHKSQGQTLSKAIVDLVPQPGRKGPVQINFAYVPLSRVRTLKDLTILRSFNPEVLRAKIDKGCVDMLEEFKQRDECKDT